MRRRWIAAVLTLALLLLLPACHLQVDLPDGSATLVCRVTAKSEKTLTVETLSEDIHYDSETTLIVKYRSIDGGTSIDVGDDISITYYYLEDVTVQDKTPCITVDTVTKTKWVPPETTEPPAAETE